MADLDRFLQVDFRHFKAFKRFALPLRAFNILVGPNNAGKSTVLAAFRILAAAMRRASARNPTTITGPEGRTLGYSVDLSAISVAEENIFFDYDDSTPATVRFRISNGNELLLYFPAQGACYLIADSRTQRVTSTKTFRAQFNCPIGFVPILGPVEHNEPLYEREAARLAMFSYRAARNFRNIWFHFPDRFEDFRRLLTESWPGMDIERPSVDHTHERPRLHMFCPEERIPRELFWAGFGFQVWCQMLTHMVQASDVSLFLIDEPDIYLHSDLQRQLVGMLRTLGPDILVATHSTEIISEADADDIVLISKRRRHARRIKQPAQLTDVYELLGSNVNPVLTQLAKTRRVVFLEGKDFQILGRFARKLGFPVVAARSEFAVVSVEGFNPERARNIQSGIEFTLGGRISSAVILDRDYRSDAELAAIEAACRDFVGLMEIHKCKEVENFLLVPTAIDRAAGRKVDERNTRAGTTIVFTDCAADVLREFAAARKSYVTAQYVASRRRFERSNSPAIAEEEVIEKALAELEESWDTPWQVIPGKEALAAVNEHLQRTFGVSVTPAAIVDAMRLEEVPAAARELLRRVADFAAR